MLIKSKYKIARRLGPQVFEKTQTQKFAARAAKKSRNLKSPRTRSDFGKALLEKQKCRFTYGINERQFSKYAIEALKEKKKKPEESFFERLETRLDNVIYRMKLAKTIRQGRQIITHGHILVNGKRVRSPSYQTRAESLISIAPGSQKSALFSSLTETAEANTLPDWVSFDTAKKEGRVLRLPKYQPLEIIFDIPMILEFYKR